MRNIFKLLRPPHYVYWAVHFALLGFGVALVQIANPVMVACGSSLIAAAVTGWVVFAYVLVLQRTAEQLDLLKRFGITFAFDSRSVRIKTEYTDRIARAEKRIDIMGFGLSALREDFINEFRNWSQRSIVRILLIDPAFPSQRTPFADQRDREEGNPNKSIQNDVREFLRACSELIADPEIAFDVRLYTCLPSVNIFRIDDELFWGPYLIGGQSRNLPTFLVESGGILFQRMMEHFEQIWSDEQLSRAVPDDLLGGQ